MLGTPTATGDTKRIELPHRIDSGEGTEASPYTHADNTGGIQTKITALAADRGGLVELQGRYSLSTQISIENPAITLRGRSLAGMIDGGGGGADVEGISGTKLKWTADTHGISIGKATGRPHATKLENLYLDGFSNSLPADDAAMLAAKSAIIFENLGDLTVVRDVHIRGWKVGIRCAGVHTGITSGVMDAATFHNVRVMNCVRPLYMTGTAYYAKFLNCHFDDNKWGVLVNGLGTTMIGCTLLRNCREDDAAVYPGIGNIGLVWAANNGQCIGNHISTYRHEAVAAHTGRTLRIDGSDNIFSGNVIGRSPASNGVMFSAGANRNHFIGNTEPAAYAAYSETNSIYVDTGALDNRIDVARPWVVFDSGTRTIINGVSKNAGDPNSAGNWNGIVKPDGLFIRDTTNDITYLYYQHFDGGRIEVGGGAGANVAYTNADNNFSTDQTFPNIHVSEAAFVLYFGVDYDNGGPVLANSGGNLAVTSDGATVDRAITASQFIPGTVPNITGSRAGNAALADLLTKLATIGLITDGTS